MPIINITIRDKKPSDPTEHIVCGNSDYKINFDFDSEWDEYEVKTARFSFNTQHIDVVFSGNVCDVPVLSNITLCSVGVFAGNIRTTTKALIKCRKSILCDGGVPTEPTPDVYAQIMELLNSGGGGGGTQGPPGPKGEQGPPGESGEDGYTPVKGVDYWTQEDRQEIVGEVLAALPAAEGVGF